MTPAESLAYRFTITNCLGFAGLTWAASQGYVAQVFENDVSHISYGITALAAVGFVSSALWVGRIAYNPDAPKEDFEIGTAHLSDLPEWLVTLGLIGNVIGFVIALHGVSIDALTDAAGAQKVAGGLLAGMGVAFYSTLAGAVFALWQSVNVRMIKTTIARM